MNSELSRGSSLRNKQIKIIYSDEIKTTTSVASYKDLVKYMFSVESLEYFERVPVGVDPKYGTETWFNFWFEDAQKETYPISNEEEF